LLAALDDADTERAGVQEQLDHANERLTEAWNEVLKNTDVQRAGKSLAEATDEALNHAYAQGAEGLAQAADALRRYLVGQGLPAAPVRLADPDLDALATALL
jgi:chemotaxis regulatin CheY-phosphate phosphatase CheZ